MGLSDAGRRSSRASSGSGSGSGGGGGGSSSSGGGRVGGTPGGSGRVEPQLFYSPRLYAELVVTGHNAALDGGGSAGVRNSFFEGGSCSDDEEGGNGGSRPREKLGPADLQQQRFTNFGAVLVVAVFATLVAVFK